MKVLLTALNAKYIHSNLAIYSLRSYAKQYKDHIEIVEYTINNQVDFIIQEIYKKKPDLIAFSCYIWNIKMVEEVTEELHKLLPDVPIWLGGPEVSYEVEQGLLKQDFITGIMIGEGEETFLELLSYYFNRINKLEEIKGIAYKQDNVICVNTLRMPLSLDQIPFPYDEIHVFHNKIIYYETSRGCPYSCSYCLSSIEKGVRLRNIEFVKKELMIFLTYQVPQVKFIDRTFNCNHNHAMEIWTFIKEHDNGITNFHFEISADLLREDEIALLNSMRIGLVQLEIGVQSTNKDTIKAIHRSMDLQKLRYAVGKIASGKNIHQHLDLIAGLPYENYESFRDSFQDVYQMRPDQLQLGFLKVLKGSAIYKEAHKNNIVYKSNAPYEVLFTKWLPYDKVLKLKQIEEMVEVYYNSGQFPTSIRYLESFYSYSFDLYEALGEFYEKKGYHCISHTRNNRYEILLEFCEENKEASLEVMKELLVYDIYLRENLKSRPSFAREYSVPKESFYHFYQEDDTMRKYLPDYEAFSTKQISKMTHLEYFTIDIFEWLESGKLNSRGCFVLYDYKNRDLLNRQARVVKLSLLELRKE